MFEHPAFRTIDFEDIPLDEDLFVTDVKWMSEYEQEWLRTFSGNGEFDYSVGYVSYAAAQSVGNDWLEMSWYPNLNDRFHEVPVFLPKSQFVACVEVPKYGDKPRVFVRTEWLTALHERSLAAFALVDAIGIKASLRDGRLTAGALQALRTRVDRIAAAHPELGFVSFADSLLVKQVWHVGHVGTDIRYSYAPESLLTVIPTLHEAIAETLGLGAYTVMSQGVNAYADGEVLHFSGQGNHVSLNALGLPFAQLLAIDAAAREAIGEKRLVPADVYLDSMLFRSLKAGSTVNKQALPSLPYRSPLTGAPGLTYIAMSLAELDRVSRDGR